MERLKQLVEWFDNTPFEDMPQKAQKEISDGIVELIKYKALGTLDDLAALVQAGSEGRLVELPCKIGETIYFIDEKCDKYTEEVNAVPCCGHYWDNVYKRKMWGCFGKDKNGEKLVCEYRNMTSFVNVSEMSLDWMEPGRKTIFLTREEAEAALAAKETREAREKSNGNNE